jgi:serine/threonine protein kinase
MTVEPADLAETSDIFDSESQALLNLHHPNIIRMYDYFRVVTQFFLILEYCPSGSLHEEIIEWDGLPLSRFVLVARQVVDGLAYCHSQGIAHCDVKPGNILFDEKRNCKIADFGLCMKATTGLKLKQNGGSVMFNAPEIVLKKAHDLLAGDVWALGVVFAMMVTGGSPWNCESIGELKHVTLQGTITFRRPVPAAIEELRRRMIVVEPEGRLTMAEIANHPVLRQSLRKEVRAGIGEEMWKQWKPIRRIEKVNPNGDQSDGQHRGNRVRDAKVLCLSCPGFARVGGLEAVKTRMLAAGGGRGQATFTGFADGILGFG